MSELLARLGELPPPVGALFTGLLVLFGLAFARRYGSRLAARLAQRTATGLDDELARALDGTSSFVLVLVAAGVATSMWLPETAASRWTGRAAVLAGLYQLGAWASVLVRGFAARKRAAAVDAGQPADATAWTAMSFLARLALWSVLGLVALDNVGIDVTALVAGLGIGGLAIGLAVQNVLGDLFASLAIVLDRPFSIGDFLVVGEVAGTVEHVGLKTTRIRALSGEQIVCSNADLLGSRIRNFQRLEERRVVLAFGVVYGTPPDVLEAIPGIVRRIVEAQPDTRFDRAHFHRLGDSSLDFEVVYYLRSAEYTRHMDVQQAVLLGLVRELEATGVDFAFPTRTLHVHGAALMPTRPSPVVGASA